MDDLVAKCSSLSDKYSMKTIGELARSFGFKDDLFIFSKSAIRDVISTMIGDSIKQAEENTDKRIILKTIGTTKEGNKKFDNKLFMVDFNDLLNKEQQFKHSQFYHYFKNTIFIYAMYEFPDKKVYNQGNCRFLGFKIIEFDDLFINSQVKKVWDAMRDTVFSGHLKDVPALDKYGDPIINPSGTIRSAPNFPKSSDGIVFIRGGGIDSSIKPITISDVNMYQQFVWLRGDYVLKRLLSEVFL